VVEVGDRARPRHECPQQVVNSARVGQPARRDDVAMLDAQIEVRARGDPKSLLLHGLPRSATDATNDGIPIDPGQE